MGDPDFERLFDEQFNRCVRIARRLVRDEAVAEELAAEAFARAWSWWPRLRTQAPAGWVLRVTANLAIDATRRRVPSVGARPVAPTPDEAALLHIALTAALRALPRRQREAVVLRYLADLSEAEVAASLGVSPGAVKSHLHRGLVGLRTSLGPDHDPEVDLAIES